MKKRHEASKEAKAVLARALGVESDNVQMIVPEWFDLMKEGVLVSIHIGRWRAKSKLSFSDLGLPEELDESKGADLLSLGTKFLLPAALVKKADSIESKARKALKKATFQTYWGAFVGVSGFSDLMEELEALKTEYFDLRDHLVSNYEEVKGRLSEEYKAVAGEAYRRLRLLSPVAAESFSSADDFVETFLDNVSTMIPKAQVISDSFYFSIELSYIPLPSLLEEDLAEAELVRAKARTDYEAEEERRRAIVALEEAEALKAEVKRRKAVADRDLQWKAEEEKRKALERMNLEVVAQARSQKEELVEGFLSQIVGDLRSITFEAASDVLASIRRNETLVPRSVVQLRGLVEKLDQMNFFEDKEIGKMISEIRSMIDTDAGERDVLAIRKSLENIALVTRADLIGLGESVRGVRSLGLSNTILPADVERARRDLGLDVEESIEAPELFRKARVSG